MLQWEGDDFLSAELGAAPKKKAAAKAKPKPKAKAPAKPKAAPKARPAPRPAPKPKAAKPAPKARPAPKPKPLPKAKPAPKPKAAKPPPKAKPAPRVKPPVKAKPSKAEKKLKKLPPAKKQALKKLVAAAKAAPKPIAPVIQSPAPQPVPVAPLFTPALTVTPEPEPEELPEDPTPDEETPEAESEDEQPQDEESSSDDESSEDSGEDSESESGDEEGGGDVELGSLLDTIRRAVPKLSISGLSRAQIGARATAAIAPVCNCAGASPQKVRAKLDKKMRQRGYPAGSADKLLASIGTLNTRLSKFATQNEATREHKAKAGAANFQQVVTSRLKRLSSALPPSHPVRKRAQRFTAKRISGILLTSR